jgi:hypothetical protein
MYDINCSKNPTKISQDDHFGLLPVITKEPMHPDGYVRSVALTHSYEYSVTALDVQL